MKVLIAMANCLVGSDCTSSYMLVSDKCSVPSYMYFCISSTTMPDPLSAFLIIRVLSVTSCLKALYSSLVRLGSMLLSGKPVRDVFILCRYVSISCDALGGVHILLSLNGCGSASDWFLK